MKKQSNNISEFHDVSLGKEGAKLDIKMLYFLFSYAPVNTVGTFRNLKFSKYFERHGFKQYIFTGEFKENIDIGLNAQVPISATIYRKKVFPYQPKLFNAMKLKPTFFSQLKYSIKDIFFSPDKHVWWVLSYLPQMIKVVRKEKINIVMVSCPDASLFLAGYFLKKLFRVKLVFDYRDPWNDCSFLPNITKIRRLIMNFWQRTCVKNADLIISAHESVSEQLIKDFRPKAKTLFIPNGFDSEDLKEIFAQEQKRKDKFTFFYAGKYLVSNTAYDPTMLLTAFNAFIERYELSNCELVLVGLTDEATKDYIKSINKKHIIYHDLKPKTEVFEMQYQADALIHFFYPNTSKELINMKVREYAIFQKPIICFNVKEGALFDFLEENKLGATADTHDIEDMINLFHKAYTKNIEIGSNPKEQLKEYDIEYLTSIIVDNIYQLFTE